MARAAGSSLWSWGLLGAMGLGVVVLQPLGCGEPAEDPNDDALVDELLAEVSPEVVVPSLDAARTDAEALVEAVRAWEEVAGTESDDGSARDAARDAWRDAVRSWQVVEVMQLGPLGASSTAVGGQDLRDAVYSWPDVVNPCRVDQETVRGDFAGEGWADGSLVNVLGYDALEHLLFAGPDNVCPPQVDINEEGTWDAAGEEGIASARAAYAVVLAEEIVADIGTAEEAFSGPFADELAGAGDGGVYESPTEALNAVFDAAFYIETMSKDRKLAQPLGLRDCAEDTCPEDVEHLASGESLEAIRANLDGFERLFTGGEGVGMDDVLRDRGHGDLADEVLADVAAARVAADALDRPLDEGVVDASAETQALHDAIKGIADDMKGDIATVLSMRIPSEAAGDLD